MKKLFLLFVASNLAYGGVAVNPPSKLNGPNGASVDTSSGISINPGSGGAVNVVSGDTYVPTRIDFSTTVSPTLTGGGHAAIAFDGTNLKLSINGGAYTILGGSATSLVDSNGLNVIQTTATASAVDYFTFTNAATANPATVTMAATGSDASIGITISPKGTGGLSIKGTTGSNHLVSFKDSTGLEQSYIRPDNGAFYGQYVSLNVQSINLGNSTCALNNALIIQWSSDANFYGTKDFGIARNAAGIGEINNGTAGQYRDLILRNITVGGSSGTQITLIRAATTTWDPASLANGASEKKSSVTLTGVAAGDVITASLSTVISSDWAVQATVTATDTVEVKITNNTGGTVDLASGTLRVQTVKF